VVGRGVLRVPDRNLTGFERMKFLLLIAHGSRRQNANEEIAHLAERIAARDDNGYDGVMPAFLEMAEPNIHQGIKRCVELGAEHIVVMAGNHVNKDIPGEIACAQAGAPGVKIEISQYLGASEAMASLVLDCSRQVG
jgi:sirohydrochlorin ferrochelatase